MAMKNTKLILELGRYDNPEKQTQNNYVIDLFRSNLAVFGNAMSGKTTLIKTLLLRLHQKSGLTDKEEIYILDFGHSLKEFAALPYVAGYFDAALEENVRRIFKILDEKLNRNIKTLGGRSYVDAPDDKRPSHVTFVLDGFSSFYSEDRYAIYLDDLKKLAREGLSRGISVVITAAETSGFGRLSSSFKQMIAFDLPQDQYAEIFGKRVEKPIILQGRGLANLATNVYEFHAFLPWNEADPKMNDVAMILDIKYRILFSGLSYDPALLKENLSEQDLLQKVLQQGDNNTRFQKKLHDAYLNRKLRMFPEKLTTTTWTQYASCAFLPTDGNFIAGLDYYTMEPIPSSFNLKDAHTIAIYGRKEFGKSNLLKLLLEAAKRIPNTHFCFWEDGRHALTKPAGLQQVINSLESREFVSSREEFMECLERCGFPAFRRFDTPANSAQRTIPASTDSIEVDKEEKELQQALAEWDSCWQKEFQQQRAQMQANNTWTREYGESIWNQHQIVYKQRKEAINNKINQLRDSHCSATTAVIDTTPAKKAVDQYSLIVFVIQSRLFYQNPPQGETYHMIPQMMSALGNGHAPVLFIFSDVQRIESREVQVYFNNSIRHAFLLDDLVRFISNKGQNSVFSNQDILELKERFGPCELGDGFYFDIDRDELTKLKFIHSNPEGHPQKEDENG